MNMPLEFFLTYVDSLAAHVSLLIYLFAILDERPGPKRLRRLAPMLLSPLIAAAAAMGIYLAIRDLPLLRHALNALAVLLSCTGWVGWGWRLDFRQAFACVCMAAVFQAAVSALLQALYGLSALQAYLLGTAVSLLTARALWRVRFGRSFRLLLEEGEGLLNFLITIRTGEDAIRLTTQQKALSASTASA